MKARAGSRGADLAPVIAELRASGAPSLRALAAGLDRLGIATSRGASWSPMAVSRTLDRLHLTNDGHKATIYESGVYFFSVITPLTACDLIL